MTRRILITVPNILRDLEGHSLVGYHLSACYGHDVRYTTGPNLSRDLLSLAPDLLVLDHLAWDYRAKQASLAKRIGTRLVVLPTSGLFQDMAQHQLIAGRAFRVSGLVDCYLAWGEQGRHALLENGLMREEQIRTVGCPRFDFYSPPYTAMIQDRAPFLASLGVKDPAAPVILWAPPNVAHAAVGSDAVTRWRAGTNVDPAIFKEEMDDALDQYREHSPLIVELARRRPAWNIIVKVHPSDQLSRFLWMRESANSIRVVQGAPIRELLSHCEVLLQRCSTSANEAWLLGKPVLSLGTEREALKISPSYAAGNETVRSLDDVLAAVDGILAEPRISEAQQQARLLFIEETYFRVDGRSSERCARRIDEMVSPPHHTDADQERIQEAARIAFAEFERADIARATRRLKAMIGIKPGRSFRFWRRAPAEAAESIPVSNSDIKVDDLYARFASLHATGCREPGPRPSGGVSGRARSRAAAGSAKE